MYRTPHNDGREGDREVGKRWRGDKEGVVVKRRKEERERTEGEGKITFCRVRGKERERERERERGRKLVGRKRMEESEGGG